MKKSVAVVGATGLVGSYLFSKLKKQEKDGHPITVVGTGYRQLGRNITHLDLLDFEAVDNFLDTHMPRVLFMPAAFTNVDLCQSDAMAYRMNVLATKYIIELASHRNCKVVFFSSGYVFDGTKSSFYDTDDAPNPLNNYGVQKLKGEMYTMSNPSNLVIRTMGVFGKETARKNFVYSVLDNMATGKTVHVPDDQYMCPIHASALAEVAIRMVEMNECGIVHVNGETCVSKYEFAKMITDMMDVDNGFLRPVSTENLRQPALRPSNACMTNTYSFDYRHMLNLKQGLKRVAYELFG